MTGVATFPVEALPALQFRTPFLLVAVVCTGCPSSSPSSTQLLPELEPAEWSLLDDLELTDPEEGDSERRPAI